METIGLSYPHNQCQIKSFARLLGSHKKPSTVYHVGTVVIGYTLLHRYLQHLIQSLSKLVKPITVISGHADGLKNSCTSFLYSSSPVRNNLVLRKRRNLHNCCFHTVACRRCSLYACSHSQRAQVYAYHALRTHVGLHHVTETIIVHEIFAISNPCS